VLQEEAHKTVDIEHQPVENSADTVLIAPDRIPVATFTMECQKTVTDQLHHQELDTALQDHNIMVRKPRLAP